MMGLTLKGAEDIKLYMVMCVLMQSQNMRIEIRISTIVVGKHQNDFY